MTAAGLYPSGSATAAPPSLEDAPRIDRALAIRAAVMLTDWPASRQVQKEIRARLADLDEILGVRDQLLNDPEFGPLDVGAPDMGWWWDEEDALEYVDDQALQRAGALWKRMDEGLRFEARIAAEREKSSSKGETAA